MPTPFVGRVRDILNAVEGHQTGSTHFVHSGTGASSNGGESPEDPLATTAQALALCTANKGDRVVLMPGHAETISAAAGLAISVAGVSIIGLGTGSLRPTFTFDTAVGADLDIDAANVTISNVLFLGGVDALTGPIDINAADCRLLDIETRDVTGQTVDFIVTDANCDRLLIDGWVHRGAAAAGAATALSIVGGDGVTVRNFWIDGNFSVAAIENVTTAATNLTVGGGTNYIRTRNAADVAITLVATSTGNIGPNINIRLQDDAANVTECLVGADAQFFPPLYVVNADGELGLAWNGTATVDEA